MFNNPVINPHPAIFYYHNQLPFTLPPERIRSSLFLGELKYHLVFRFEDAERFSRRCRVPFPARRGTNQIWLSDMPRALVSLDRKGIRSSTDLNIFSSKLFKKTWFLIPAILPKRIRGRGRVRVELVAHSRKSALSGEAASPFVPPQRRHHRCETASEPHPLRRHGASKHAISRSIAKRVRMYHRSMQFG